MQTASTNICERLCNKSICDISWLLNIPWSTVSGIIAKWKQLATTATQPPSDRPRSGRQNGVSACSSTQCAQVDNCLQS
ncbi:unnamed protein product [Staurois parvus]|uniref:Uncharacterized protein n=1 Tax=Staurois parvus TaxID=386267 RepID=A0ABN9DZ60_9NEOB|nr:unnamed protein product [Staurois parvus]